MTAIRVYLCRSLLALVGVLLAECALWAQDASISGRVADPSGAVVVGADILVTNIDTGIQRTTSSNEDGLYAVPRLSPGTYSVSAKKVGFKPQVHSGIELHVGQAARFDLALEMGAMMESVVVRAETTLLKTTTSEVSALMDPVRMTELPLNGRNAVELAGLLPGVDNVSAPQYILDTNNGPTLSVSGSRGGQNMMMFDGGSYTGDFRNVSGMYPPPDAILEFKVSTNLFSAEFGSNSGGVVTAVTRSGTNELHGNFYEFLRNSDLNARDFFLPRKSSLIQNQFGLTNGGPVVRNKLFYFGSLEFLKIRPEATAISAYPLTSAQRQGDFSAITTAIIDPDAKTPFPDNQIPTSRFDTVATALRDKVLPLPNQSDGRYYVSVQSPSNMYSLTLKFDYQLSSKHSISNRFFRNNASQFSPISPSNVPYSPNTQGSAVPLNDVLSWTSTLSNTVVNQVRASVYYTTDYWDLQNVKTFADLGGKYPAFGPRLPTWFNVSGYFNLQGGYPKRVSHHQYELYDDLWVSKRQHSIKLGGRFHRNDSTTGTWGPKDGSFSFDGSVTGNALADFMLGKPTSLSITSKGWFSNFVNNQMDFYIQDDWRVNPRLTLNLGVHYQLQLPWTEGEGQWGAVLKNSGFQSKRFSNAPIDLAYIGDPGVPTGLIKTNWHQVQPRLGFAYTPDFLGGKTVLRGGAGIFGELMNGQVIQNTLQPFQFNTTIYTPQQLSDPLRGTGITSVEPNLSNPTFTLPLSVNYPNPDFTNGYVVGYNFFVQREVANNLSIEVGYVGKTGRKLYWVLPANPAAYIPGTSTLANINARRIFRPGLYADLTEATSSANSSYNSLQVQVIRKLARGFSVQGAYTLSKSIDDVSGVAEGSNTVNPFDRRGDRGLSDFDHLHNANVTVVTEIPNLKGNSIYRIFTNNWQVSGIFTARSGGPFTVTSGRDIALSGTGGQTGNVVGDPVRSHSSKENAILQWFNKAAFAVPAAGTFGNSGRNNMRGPGYWNITGGLFRNFPIKERFRLQFRSEFFNLLNHANLGNPGTNMNSSSNFGVIRSSRGGPRVIQFALKLSY
jgi:hypothetical protein